MDALIEAELALYKAKAANIGKQDRKFKGVEQLQLLVPKMSRGTIDFEVILERLSSSGDILSLDDTVFMVEEAVAVMLEMFGGGGCLEDTSTVANLLSMHSYNMVMEHMPRGYEQNCETI